MKEQQIPHNLEAEHAIFSLILLAPERFMLIVDLLTASDFYSEANQQIWTAMTELFKEGQELDIVSIRGQLKKQEISVAPALKALSESFDNNVLDGNLLHFVKEVKDKSMLRQIIRVTKAQNYNAQLEDAVPREVLSNLEKDILTIIDKSTDAKPSDATGIITEVRADIANVSENGWKGYQTGFIKLDDRIGGLIPTQSWIIGAYTGVGKTFFILQILLNVLRQGGKVMLFSTEMDRKLNMLRLIGNIAGLGTIDIMRGKLLANELEELRKAQEELEQFKKHLIIYDNVYTLGEIRLKAKKAKLSGGLDLVAVDFIQNLRGPESIYERMSEAAIGLQQLAQELEVSMVIGSQISQASAGWSNKEAIEFKGAGEIAAIADVALWITKEKEGDKSLRRVNIRKARHAQPGKFEVRLSFPSGRVIDMENQEGSNDDVKSQL